MILADLTLARRLEATEARACAEFAQARKLLEPEVGAEVLLTGGTTAAFDGVASPITQTFGLGLFEPLTELILDRLESFFRKHGAPIHHEVCPLAGVATLDLLCLRGYRPIELTSVMYQELTPTQIPPLANPNIAVRLITPDETPLWANLGARAWSHSYPEMFTFMEAIGPIFAQRKDSPSFLATLDGIPAATASLFLNQRVALFAGAATLAERRRQGLQSALLEARRRFAAEAGCDLAMMCAEAGSESQRNAQRNGFKIAYTRTKWLLKE